MLPYGDFFGVAMLCDSPRHFVARVVVMIAPLGHGGDFC